MAGAIPIRRSVGQLALQHLREGPGRHPARASERGISIVLAMLVLFVLLVVVFQVVRQSELELDKAALHVESVRFRYLADACAQQALSTLVMDLEDAAEQEQGAQDPSLGGGGGDSEIGDSLSDTAAGITASTDSLLDEWNNPTALAPPLGEGLEIYVEVVDEDSKINLLALWGEEDEEGSIDDWREVVVRLLDKAFEGTSQDLSAMDAEEVIDRLDEWVQGNRSGFDLQVPLPPLKKSQAQDEAERELDTDIIENDKVHFPLTVGELAQIEPLGPEHLWGFVEDDVFYPGLTDLLTVWSHLELKQPEGEAEDDPFSNSPFDTAADEDSEDQQDGEGGPGDGEDDGLDDSELSASGTLNGRVNVNLASLPVLRALAPDDIPTSFLEKIVEFRERILEVRDEVDRERDLAFNDPGNSIFNDPGDPDLDYDDPEDEEDPTRFVFQSETEVFDKVEEEMELSVFTDDEDKEEFIRRLGVVSQVFTIKILIRDPKAGRRSSYRTIVWRMETGEGPRMVTLLPLERFYDARRLEDISEELEDLSQERFERERYPR